MRVYAIQHKPTGEWMPARMGKSTGRGWSSWIPGPELDGWAGSNGYGLGMRIFFTKRSAQNALTSWLQGISVRECGVDNSLDGSDYYDELSLKKPPVPRVREDMVIVEMSLEAAQ